YVVAVRLGADQLAGVDEHHASLVLDRDPRRALGAQIEIGQHLEQPRGTLLSRAPHRHVQSLVYPFRVERLQNVVHGALFERLDCVLLVGGDEDDRRHRPVLLAEPLPDPSPRSTRPTEIWARRTSRDSTWISATARRSLRWAHSRSVSSARISRPTGSNSRMGPSSTVQGRFLSSPTAMAG